MERQRDIDKKCIDSNTKGYFEKTWIVLILRFVLEKSVKFSSKTLFIEKFQGYFSRNHLVRAVKVYLQMK